MYIHEPVTGYDYIPVRSVAEESHRESHDFSVREHTLFFLFGRHAEPTAMSRACGRVVLLVPGTARGTVVGDSRPGDDVGVQPGARSQPRRRAVDGRLRDAAK